MIAEATYFIAERGGFTGDGETCWLEAEREIDGCLAQRRTPHSSPIDCDTGFPSLAPGKERC